MEIQTSELGHAILGSAIEVHSALGPGLLESVYERCVACEFRLRGLVFERQVAVPIRYKGESLDCGYRIDFIVEGKILLELKSVEKIAPIHTAQMLTYLKLMNIRQGFLINFNVKRLKDGISSFLL